MQLPSCRSSARFTRVIGPLGLAPLLSSLACTPDNVSIGSGRASIEGSTNPACPLGVVPGNVTTTQQEHIDALEGCEEIGGDLWIVSFEGMDLHPLGSLRVVRSNLIVGAQLPNGPRPVPIESLEGLDSLERASSLSLLNVSAPDLSALSSLTTVQRDATSQWHDNGYVEIRDCNQLRDLKGLENLAAWDRIILENNESLESLDGLGKLPWEVGGIYLSYLPRLRDIGALAGVDKIHDLWISRTALENVDGLDVQYVDDLGIDSNAELRSLAGWKSLLGVQHFYVGGNAQLESLVDSPLWGLEVLQIHRNPELRSVPSYLAMGADQFVVEISDNAKLTDIGAPSQSPFGQQVVINDNPNLTHLSLGALKNVDVLSLRNNASLSSVDTSALETVDSLEVVNNPQLSTAAFAEVRSFSADISGNMDNPAP